MKTRAEIVLEVLREHGKDTDVAIVVLYERMTNRDYETVGKRGAQQAVGSTVHRINKRLKGEKIVVGNGRHTYRIVDVG